MAIFRLDFLRDRRSDWQTLNGIRATLELSIDMRILHSNCSVDEKKPLSGYEYNRPRLNYRQKTIKPFLAVPWCASMAPRLYSGKSTYHLSFQKNQTWPAL